MTNLAVLAPDIFPQLVNQTGTAPAVGFKLFTYQAGTSIKQPTYLSTFIDPSNQNSNPILTASDGSYTAFLDPTLVYKFVLAPPNDTDPPSSPIGSKDNIYPSLDSPNLSILLSTILTQATVGGILYPQTPAELLAGITPQNLWIPSHLAIGVFIWDRYGTNGVGVDMTAPINNSMAVATANGGGISQGLAASYKTTAALNVPDLVTLRGSGRFKTTIVPTGSGFNAINVHGTNETPNFANARMVQDLAIIGTSFPGNGLDILFAGLRCKFSELYIQGCFIGMKISASFDHSYEHIECRANTSMGVQVYEQQSGYDGVFNEVSRLMFNDVVAAGNNLGVQLAYTAVTGTYATGEPVTQATSGATATVNYYDVANLRLYVTAVAGTFDTSHVVTGGTSGATGTPASTTGSAAINQVQWDQAGGDNCSFYEIKATEGFVGIDFSRASNEHTVYKQYYDSTIPGSGTAIQVSKPSLGTVQYLTIGVVNSSSGNIGVNIIGGQNIFIGTVQMNSSGTPVSALAAAAGPIFLTTPRTVFTDANVPQIVYPAENITTYTPSFGGTGGSPALGTGTITGETYQHGNKVSLRIQFTFGSSTVMATSFLLLGLPAALGVKGSETQLGQALAIHGSNVFLSTASLSTTSINIPVSGGATNWNSTIPFVWASGDALVITAEYEVN